MNVELNTEQFLT